MAEATFGSRLRQILLALLNATLLLAVLLVFGLWLLIGRVENLAADTAAAAVNAMGPDVRARAAAEFATLSDRLNALSGLQGRIDGALAKVSAADSSAAAEVAGLRGDVQAMTGAVNGVRSQLGSIQADASGSFRATVGALLMEIAEQLRPAALQANQ